MKPQHLRLRALRRQLEIEEARLRGRALGAVALIVAVGAGAAFVVHHPARATAPAPFVAGERVGLTGVSPEAVPRGAGSFLLTVTGTGFGPDAAVHWNGQRRPTQVLSSTRLAASIGAADIDGAGPHAVTVVTGGVPSGGTLRVATYERAMHDGSADRVLGQPGFDSRVAYHPAVGGDREGVVNAAGFDRLGPQGVAIDPASGRLFVAETRGARVLSWPSARAFHNAESADLVLGQPDESSAGPKEPDARTMCSPQAVAVDPQGSLYVSDDCHHRVLRFDPPFATGMGAAAVFGQDGSFTSAASNKGGRSARSLSHPGGLVAGAQGLFVHDGGNRRVLHFRKPRESAVADVAIGQADLASFEAGPPSARRLASEDGALALDPKGALLVADTMGNRVLRFSPPFANGMAADVVLGQKDFAQTGRSSFADGLWRPAALAFDAEGNLLVAESGNHRVVRYASPLASGMSANGLLGQAGFGLARAGAGASRLASPSGLAIDGAGDVIVADGGNARVLAFDRPFAPAPDPRVARGTGREASRGR